MHFPLCIYHPPNAADWISESLTGALEQSIVLQACLGTDKKSWMLTCLVFIGFWEQSWRRTHSKILSTFLCVVYSFVALKILFWPNCMGLFTQNSFLGPFAFLLKSFLYVVNMSLTDAKCFFWSYFVFHLAVLECSNVSCVNAHPRWLMCQEWLY